MVNCVQVLGTGNQLLSDPNRNLQQLVKNMLTALSGQIFDTINL
jgi:hypothetical protein